MSKVACYYRVSSKGQEDRGTIENQRHSCREYCERQDWIIAQEFDDPAVSGTMPLAERPQGSQLVKMIESGEIEAVVAVNLDRFTRSSKMAERGYIFDLLAEYGLVFASPREGVIDPSTFVGDVTYSLFTAKAKQEREDILARQQRGRDRAKRENRYAAGGIPYGLRWVNDKDLDKTHWAVDERQYQVLREAATLIKQGVSITTVVAIFNGNLAKYPPKYAKRWSHNNLWSMFTKHDVIFTGIRSDGVDTGIRLFTEEEITEVRRKIKLNRRNKVQAETPKGSFLLRRMVKCECGWFLSAVTIDGLRRYYRCKRCSYGLRADEIDREVWQDYVNTVGDPLRLRKAVLDGDFAVTSRERELYQNIQEANRKRLEELGEEQRRLNLLFVKREIDREQHKMLKATLDKEVAKANQELEQAQLKLSKPTELKEILAAAAKSVAAQVKMISRMTEQVESHLMDFPIHKEARLTGLELSELKDRVLEMKRSMLIEELARGGSITVKDRGLVKLQFFVPNKLPEPSSGQTTFG